ncbi:ATP-binding cassette domain-containing protein, partial [Synechococcus sp. AH-551-N23]|nr:ATP-binding cassette domain-containing protein [Synechococcus sp. AH-551-N23]
DQIAILNFMNQKIPENLTERKPIQMQKSMRLKNIYFSYKTDHQEVIQNLNLEIARGERIGLIGKTGSGKSTLVDIAMGLLKPTSGQILVDGEDLYDEWHPGRIASWREAIAHVPQNIYLTDSSIAENIAFGVPLDQIDMTKVKRAAEQAHIATFIESRPDDYKSLVGERGVRLSGGQRQRLGIARALYKQVQILVMDEATSALDVLTEETVMKSIDNLNRDLTVIIIAHRTSTLMRCDRIVRLYGGEIINEGTPKEVLI